MNKNWQTTSGGLYIPMPKIVKVFGDECKGGHQNFQFWTFIWGSEDGCKRYQDYIANLIKQNSNFPKNFQTFHANRLKKGTAKLYKTLIETFFDFIKDGHLSCLMFCESNEKVSFNSDHIFDILNRYIMDEGTEFGKIFKYIPDKVKKAIAHQMKSIYYLWYLRDTFGREGDHFDFHPDASSNILTYLNESYPVISNIGTRKATVQSLISSIARAAIVAFEKEGPHAKEYQATSLRKNLNQDIRNFFPLPDEDSFIIQTADAICNLLAASFAVELGSTKETALIKRDLIGYFGIFEEIIPEMIKEMEFVNDELHAKPNLRGRLVIDATLIEAESNILFKPDSHF